MSYGQAPFRLNGQNMKYIIRKSRPLFPCIVYVSHVYYLLRTIIVYLAARNSISLYEYMRKLYIRYTYCVARTKTDIHSRRRKWFFFASLSLSLSVSLLFFSYRRRHRRYNCASSFCRFIGTTYDGYILLFIIKYAYRNYMLESVVFNRKKKTDLGFYGL